MQNSKKERLVHCQVVQNRIKHLNLVTDEKTIERIIARIPKDTLKTVLEAKKDKWLPINLFLEINDHIAKEIGEEGSYNLSVKSFNKITESSIISPFIRAALYIFKVSPDKVIGLLPLIWRTLYRNTGEITIEQIEPRRLRVSFVDLTPNTSRSNMMAIAGAMNAIFSFSGVKSIVYIESFSPEEQKATFIASWSSKLNTDRKKLFSTRKC